MIITNLTNDIKIYRFVMPVIKSNMYVMPAGKSCLIVDPNVSEDAGRLLRDMGIRDVLILLTHEHYDHISGVNWLRSQLPCKVVCSKICGERICDPKKNSAAFFDALFLDRDKREQQKIEEISNPEYTCRADADYAGSLEFQWGGLCIKMIEAPGHSPGSQIIRINETNFFTGDYLIPGEDVITRLPGGSKQKYETVTKPYLEAIEPSSAIYPGHGEPTKIISAY